MYSFAEHAQDLIKLFSHHNKCRQIFQVCVISRLILRSQLEYGYITLLKTAENLKLGLWHIG
ncbi:hypothetical protein DNK59_23090 [Pseudomonas sp. TKO26]|nr:hypothetical protein DNK62_23090 [Pseudomonas sp. TKO30]PYY82989.1 hypothetical protein DNK61_22440 [Pseudomonas sp. TKO29]PYY85011.1 hypothetical protein DNK59_23090 [Pseudomonas sp. TKO26]PYY97803.1 hypothetical protein DNK60_23915 [Pseudomonas sp. TKO14]